MNELDQTTRANKMVDRGRLLIRRQVRLRGYGLWLTSISLPTKAVGVLSKSTMVSVVCLDVTGTCGSGVHERTCYRFQEQEG